MKSSKLAAKRTARHQKRKAKKYDSTKTFRKFMENVKPEQESLKL